MIRVGNRSLTTSIKRNLPIHLHAVPRASVAGTVNQITSAGAYLYVSATPDVIVLPDNAKCGGISSLGGAFGFNWGRAGTATAGEIVITSPGPPSAGHLSVSPTGDIFLNAADAWTSVDISYLPQRYDVVNAVYSCTPGSGVVAGLPSGIIFILEAEALVGGVIGKNIVVAPAAAAPTTRQAGLSLSKAGVFFCIADAVTSVRLKLGVIPAVNI